MTSGATHSRRVVTLSRCKAVICGCQFATEGMGQAVRFVTVQSMQCISIVHLHLRSSHLYHNKKDPHSHIRFLVPKISHFTITLCHTDKKTVIFSTYTNAKKRFIITKVLHDTAVKSKAQRLG